MEDIINEIFTFNTGEIPEIFEEGPISEIINKFAGNLRGSNVVVIIYDVKTPPKEFKGGPFPKFLANLRKKVYNVPCTILGEVFIKYNESAVQEALMLSNIRSLVVPSDVPHDATFTIGSKAGSKKKDITSSNFKGNYSDRLVQGVPLTVLAPGKRIRLVAKPVTGSVGTHGSDYRPITACTFRPLGDGKYIFMYEARPGFDQPETILKNALDTLGE